MGERQFWVYILSNTRRTVLYVGITNDLVRRVFAHREHMVDGFTKRYNVDELVHYEVLATAYEAITREKEIKGWRREKKLALIKTMNPQFADLSHVLSE